jgi:hypothetical protein
MKHLLIAYGIPACLTLVTCALAWFSFKRHWAIQMVALGSATFLAFLACVLRGSQMPSTEPPLDPWPVLPLLLLAYRYIRACGDPLYPRR